jgi:predicted permease
MFANRVSDVVYRLRALLGRKLLERELYEELRFHLEQLATKFVRAGFSLDEAQQMAHLTLQGIEQTKEQCRDARGTALLDTTAQDLRYALRQLKGAPAFAVVAIIVLALGIGANTAIFSLLDAVMLRSLPVRNPQQLLVPRWTAKATPHPYDSDDYEPCFDSRRPKAEGGCTFPYPIFKLVESKGDIFSKAAAFAGPVQLNVDASVVTGEIVSGSFFGTLGVHAALGRTFDEHDDTAGAGATIVLSYSYWQRAFGGDPFVIGKTVRLNAIPFTVIGVAESGFNRLSPGRASELWLPIHSASQLGISWASLPLDSEHHFWLKIIARAKPGITPARAEAALTALFRNEMVHRSKVLKSSSDPVVEITPADKALTGVREMLAKPLYVLMCAVSLILVITCANIASLMTARAAARQREIAIRLAMGAGRGRIIRQLLTESVVLAALGRIAGVAVAWWGTRSLIASIWWIHLDVGPDLRILLFTTAISLSSGLLFGIVPAIRGTRAFAAFDTGSGALQQVMSSAARRPWFGKLLVVVQVALATVMLVGAGLFERTLVNLKTIDIGFDASNILLFGVDPVSVHYNEPQIRSLYRTLRDRLAALPGVKSVTYSQEALLSNSLSSGDYQIEGRPDRKTVHMNILDVGPDFFHTMGIPLLTGRAFTSSEFTTDRSVAIVNRAFVRQYVHGRNPVGLHFADDAPAAPRYEIIGVAGDAKYNNLRDEVKPTAYIPLRKGVAHFEMRTAGNPSALIPALRAVMRKVDPDLPLFDLKTQTQQIDDTLVIERLVAHLSVSFGLLALTLACVGLYGLLSYEVTRRTHEIGIRLAIGAEPHTVRREILRETLGIVLVGLIIGVPAALLSTRALTAMLYGIEANDASTLLAIASILVTVAAVAGYLPARRASLVDPMVCLRYE